MTDSPIQLESYVRVLHGALAADGQEKCVGRIIGYLATPSYIIETEDGLQFHWSADLVIALTPEEQIELWRRRAVEAEQKIKELKSPPARAESAPAPTEGGLLIDKTETGFRADCGTCTFTQECPVDTLKEAVDELVDEGWEISKTHNKCPTCALTAA